MEWAAGQPRWNPAWSRVGSTWAGKLNHFLQRFKYFSCSVRPIPGCTPFAQRWSVSFPNSLTTRDPPFSKPSTRTPNRRGKPRAVRVVFPPACVKISFLQTYLRSEVERSPRRGHSMGTPRGDIPRGHPTAAVRCGGTRRLLSAGAVIEAAPSLYRRVRAVEGRQLRGDGRGTPPTVPPPRAPALQSSTNTFTAHLAGEKSCVPTPSGRFSQGIKGEGKAQPPESEHAVPIGTFGGRSPGPCLFLKPTCPLTATSQPSVIFRSRYFCENSGDVSAAAFAGRLPPGDAVRSVRCCGHATAPRGAGLRCSERRVHGETEMNRSAIGAAAFGK